VRKILRFFFQSGGRTPWIVVGALLVASLLEGVGVASLVPLLSLATGQETKSTALMTTTREVVQRLGLPLEVGFLGAFIVTVLLLTSVIQFFAARHVGNVVSDLVAVLRLQMIKNLFRARWSWLVSYPVGRFVSALGGEIGRVGEAYQLSAQLISQSIQCVVSFGVACLISWRLALCALALGALTALALQFLVRLSRKAGTQQVRRSREMVVFLVDSLSNLKPLRATARQAAFSNLLEEKSAAVRKASRRQVLAKQGMRSGQDALGLLFLSLGFMLAWAVWKVSVVEVLIVGFLLKKTTSAMSRVQLSYQDLAEVSIPFADVHRLMEKAASVPEPNPGTAPAHFERDCRLDRVSFSHGDRQILHDVSIVVPAGSLTVMKGPSGAGKTTIADLLLGLHVPSSGRVLVDSVPLEELDLESWRTIVGYVPQELVLFHDSVFANIQLGDPAIDEARVREALELAGAWEFVERLPQGIHSVVGQQGAKLSGGQRQRIALARALVTRPRLLVLDEVTSALDPDTERHIIQSIRSLASKMAVLSITHRPAFLDAADRIYNVEDGVVEERKVLKAVGG